MSIDVDQPGSPGWWFWRLSEEQRKRRPHLDEMWSRYEGDPPLPEGAQNAREAFQAFQKLARSNLAELATRAVGERLALLGFRTSAGQERAEAVDEFAGSIWTANEMPVQCSDIHEFMGVMGVGYSIVGPSPADDDTDGRDDEGAAPEIVDDEDALPVITAEDPREVITAHDPARESRVLAGLKYQYDPQDDVDRAFVYMHGGEVYIARRDGRGIGSTQFGPRFRFSPRGWTWENLDAPQTLPTAHVPVTRYRNPRDKGEFETHVDLLDRINHMILQRMVIATMQAFRQRAVKGLPEKDPRTGEVIDYTGIFSADPAAIWQLPATAEMWESGQVDLTPILSSVKDDMREFMANTRTPISYMTPDAANGSAEGASLTREGLTFKVEDVQLRAGVGHRRTMRLALLYADRPDLAKSVSPLWAPAERFSLAQRYDAALKSVQIGVPWRSRMLNILQFTPPEVARMEVERTQDQLLAPVAPAPAAGGGGSGESGGGASDDDTGDGSA